MQQNSDRRFELVDDPPRNGRPPAVGSGASDPSFLAHLAPLRRRWWLLVLCPLLAAGAAWWSQQNRVGVYTAEVLLQTNREPAPVAGLDMLAASEVTDVGAQLEIMRSRAVLAVVVDSLDLRLRIEEPGVRRTQLLQAIELEPDAPSGQYLLAREGSTVQLRDRRGEARLGSATIGEEWLSGPGFQLFIPDAQALDEPVRLSVAYREQAIERLGRQIRIEPGRGAGILRVRFSSVDPVLAAGVVNTMALSYQTYTAQRARDSASRRRVFLANQLTQLADSLQRAQAVLLQYQESSGMFTPTTEGGAIAAALLQAENEQRKLRFDRTLLDGLVAALSSETNRDEGLQRIMVLGQELLPGGASLYGRLQELGAERSRLTASRFGYTDAGPSVQVVDSLIAATRGQIAAVARQSLSLLEARLDETQRRLTELRQQVGDMPQRNAQLAGLQQRVDAVQTIFDLIVEKYYEAQIAEAVEGGGVEVVDPAPVPLSPDPSADRMNLIFALLAGLVVGAGGALGLDRLDTSVRTVQQAERITRLPVLGLIPAVKAGTKPDSAASRASLEAFRALRTNLHFARDRVPGVVAVTSAAPREGKSTISSNLAVILSQQGARVLLVDADLRRPTLHAAFATERQPGLTDVIGGDTKLEGAVRECSIAGLSLLTAGTPVPNAAELLGGKRFPLLLDVLQRRYDVVIVDSPPILAVTDAAIIAKASSGTLIVARADLTDIHALGDAVESLRRVDAPLIGMVVNDVPPRGGYRRYGYYQYGGYYENGKGGGPRKPRSRLLPAVISVAEHREP